MLSADTLTEAVDVATGQIGFPVVLASRAGRNGMDIALSASYSSASLRTATTNNLSAPTGVLGLGWALDLSRIDMLHGQSALPADCVYAITAGGMQSRLVRIGTNTDGSWRFAAERYVFWQISYNPASEQWRVVDENGLVSLYGGAASGTGAVDWAVAWGGWQGASANLSGQRSMAVGWALATVSDRFGDQISYRYSQMPVAVGTKDGFAFTQATYLSEIVGVDGSRVLLSYGDKSAAEYQDPHTNPAPPNAWQNPLATLYLDTVELYAGSGVLLDRVKFAYAATPLGSGGLTKRLLVSISAFSADGTQRAPAAMFSYWGQQVADGVSATSVFNAANGALYGALAVATLPSGGTVAYAYGAATPEFSARSLALTVPTGGTQPQFRFLGDVVLATWLDSSNVVHLQAYVYQGRWLMQELQTVQLASAADYANVQSVLGEGCAGLYAAGKVYAVARDAANPGAWLTASSFTTTLAANEAVTLAAGRGFVALLGLSGGVLYRYRFAAMAWVSDAAMGLGKTGNTFALAAQGAVLVALATPWDAGTTQVTLLVRDTDGSWTQSQTTPDLGSLAGTLALTMGDGFAVVRGLGTQAGGQRAQYAAIWWSQDLSSVSGEALLTLWVPTGSTALDATVAGSTVAIGRRLYRFNGVAWNAFDAGSVAYAGAGAFVSAKAGSDMFAQLFTATTAGQQVAALLVYNPSTSQWSTPSGPDVTAASPLAALPATGADPSMPYALVGTQLWYGAPDGTWSSVLSLTGFSAADLATAQILGANYLVLQKSTGTANVSTEVYLLGNGGVLNATAISIAGGQISVSGQPASALVGGAQFVAYAGSWTSPTSLTLYRPVLGAVTGQQTAYAAASVTAKNGTTDVSQGIIGTFLTQYAPQNTAATIDAQGYVAFFNKAVVIPGGANGATHPDGDVAYGIYSGLSASESPAVAYPSSAISNASAAANFAMGLVYSQQTNNAAGASTASSVFFWSVTLKTLGNWGEGGYSRQIQVNATLDGVPSVNTLQYAPETGLPTLTSTLVYNAVTGLNDTYSIAYTYWWQKYDQTRSSNMLTPIVQTVQQSQPNGQQSPSTVGLSIQTWRSDWGYGAGRWAPDRSFVALQDSPPAFDSWYPEDPAPASGYSMTEQVLTRTQAGLALSSVDVLDRPFTTTYDVSDTYAVASGFNVAPGLDMLSWFGCEPYENSAAWTSSDPSLSVWSYVTTADSHTGTQCIALPVKTGATTSGPLLMMQPSDQTRLYVFSCWARAANGFATGSGTAQWVIQPYDPATGANAGTAVTLALTPASGTPTAVGGWAYFQATIDLPAMVVASGKTALGLSILASNGNAAQVCYVDELRFSPLDCIFSATVYDPKTFRTTASIDSNGQSTQTRYDDGGVPYLKLGPNDRVNWVGASSPSRTQTGNDTFSADFPNTDLALTTSAESLYYDFRDGSLANWTFSDPANWTIADGQLIHSGSASGAVGATATLDVAAYTYLGARVEIASPQPTSAGTISFGNGSVYMQWNQTATTGGWQLVQVSGTTAAVLATNGDAPWGKSWIFTYVDGFVVCYADAVQVFSWQMAPPFAGGKAWLATTGTTAFDNLVVVNTPQISLTFSDGLGTTLEELGVEGYEPADSETYPSKMAANAGGVMLDALGRPAIEKLNLPVPVQLAVAPDGSTLIEGNPTTYLYSEDGNKLSVEDYLAGKDGFTYQQTSYETSPLSRPTQIVLPRPNDAADPATDYTVTMAYGASNQVGGLPSDGGTTVRVSSANRVQSTTSGTTRTITQVLSSDTIGRPLMAQQGASGGTTMKSAFLYDSAGRLATIQQPNYFAPPANTSASAWVETRSYTFLNQLSQMTTPDTGTTQFMYDSAGRLRFVLDADGAALTPPRILYTKYDALNRTVENGYIQDAQYTWANLQALADVEVFPIIVASPVNPNEATGAWHSRFSFDTDGNAFTRYLIGRVWQASVNQNTSGPDTERYGYDAFGNTTTKTTEMPGVSPNGGWTVSYAYNGQDKVASIAYPPLAGTPPNVTYTYDRLGRLAAVGDQVNPGGVVDPSNPPTDPAMRYASYGYAPFGQIATAEYNNVTNEEQGPVLPRSYDYDLAQRLTSISDPYFSETLSYVADGATSYYDNLIAAAQSTYIPSSFWTQPPVGFTQTFTYDANMRLSAAANTLGEQFSIALPSDGYDANGNIVKVQRGASLFTSSFVGSGAAATNKLDKIAGTASASVNFATLQPGEATNGWKWGANNGGPSASGLTTAGPVAGQSLLLAGGSLGHYEVLQLSTYLPPGATCTLSWSAATGSGYGQAIGAASWCVVLYTESGPSVVAPLATLAASSSAYLPGTATIDLPNLIAQYGGSLPIVAAGVELRNQGRYADGVPGPSIYVASVSLSLSGTQTGQSYGYDANGNVTSSPDRDLTQLSYDPTTGLTTSIAIGTSPAQNVAYAYSSDNLRSRATLTSGSPGQTLSQTVTLTGPDGAVLATQTVADGVTSTRYYVNGAQGTFGVIEGDSLRYLLTDHLGSTRVVVDSASAQVLTARDYLAFGGGQRSTTTATTDIGYTGQRLDADTGLYNYNARLYDPAIGRFYAADPAGQYPSPYIYAGDNPVSLSDPSGNWATAAGMVMTGLSAAYDISVALGPLQTMVYGGSAVLSSWLGAALLVGLAGHNLVYKRGRNRNMGPGSLTNNVIAAAVAVPLSAMTSISLPSFLEGAFEEWNKGNTDPITLTKAAAGKFVEKAPNAVKYGYLNYGLGLFTDYAASTAYTTPTVAQFNADPEHYINTLPASMLQEMWHVPAFKRAIGAAVRGAGGLHEWFEVNQIATWAKFGLTLAQVQSFTTNTGINPMFIFNGLGYAHANNAAHIENRNLLATSPGVFIYLAKLWWYGLVAPGAWPATPNLNLNALGQLAAFPFRR